VADGHHERRDQNVRPRRHPAGGASSLNGAAPGAFCPAATDRFASGVLANVIMVLIAEIYMVVVGWQTAR
jgi:hypothetical protein